MGALSCQKFIDESTVNPADFVAVDESVDDELSWMFIEGTNFSSDPRSVYDQVTDPSSPKNVQSLYLYALYWASTTVTTVGYGDVSYAASKEYIYICLLEILATIQEAYLIMALVSVFAVKRSSYEYLLNNRLKQTDEWTIFKIQN